MNGTPLQSLIAVLGLDGRNWRKHHMIDGSGRRCLLGGVIAAYGYASAEQNQVVRALATVIRGAPVSEADDTSFIITRFNDDDYRTWPQIRDTIVNAERLLLAEAEAEKK